MGARGAVDRGSGYPAAPDTSVCGVVVERRWGAGGGQRQWGTKQHQTQASVLLLGGGGGGGAVDRGSGYQAAPDTRH